MFNCVRNDKEPSQVARRVPLGGVSFQNFMPLSCGIKDIGKKLEEFRVTPSLLNVSKKEDGSVVSSADLYSSKEIINLLRVVRPCEGYVSEEDVSFLDGRTQISSNATWIIDPLDHTRRFIKGNDPYYLISLTRVENYKATYAILYQPAFEAMFIAQKALGCFINQKKLEVSSLDDFSKAHIAMAWCNAEDFFTKAQIASDSCGETAESLIAVANGSVDAAVIKVSGHKIWDIAFASLLVEEAGGLVTDELGFELSFRDIDPQINYIVASNGKIHEQVLDSLVAFQNKQRGGLPLRKWCIGV